MVDDLHSGSAHHAEFQVDLEHKLSGPVKIGFIAVIILTFILFGIMLMRLMRVEREETERMKGH
jgi:hypothetical protein